MEVDVKSSPTAADSDDAIEDAIEAIVSTRRKHIPKCSKRLEDMIQLRINAVLKAKVKLKLPGVVTTEDDVLDYETPNSDINMSEDMDADNDTSFSNAPDNDEAAFCNDMIGDVEGNTITVRTIASKVQRMHKISGNDLLTLFRGYDVKK